MEELILNWSSGKDAAMAYLRLLNDKRYKVKGLLTSLSASYRRVSMHGVTEDILDAQALRMGLPLRKIYLPENADMESYNRIMGTAVDKIKGEHINTMAFGDIFLEDLRKYREQQLHQKAMKAVFPLWKENTAELVKMVEDKDIKAMIICVNEKYLGKEFLGRIINRQLLADLPANVDPCGENGEYHTLVIDAPFFSDALHIKTGEIVHKNYASTDDKQTWDNGFYFLDLFLYSNL